MSDFGGGCACGAIPFNVSAALEGMTTRLVRSRHAATRNRALAFPTVLSALLLSSCGRPVATTPKGPPAPVVAAGPVNPAVTVATYHCADGQSLVAGYPDHDTAIVTWKGHSYSLKVVRSGSGARYTGYGLQWWTKGLTDGAIANLKAGEEVASETGLNCSTTGGAAPVQPPAPGTPGGLPDDKTPLSEAPFTPTSAQGAAKVVQTYYALIEDGKYAQAAKMRRDGQGDDFALYATYHAQVGGPGEAEGGAGSLYIEVPVVIYGRYKTGAELHQSGKVTLRRVNDVDGSTTAQRLWHIHTIALKP